MTRELRPSVNIINNTPSNKKPINSTEKPKPLKPLESAHKGIPKFNP